MIALLLALVAAQPAETPRAFLERVYNGYGSPGFNPLDHPSRYFAPALVAAIREDERLAKGEVGYLEGDPLCDCQDYAEIAMRVDGVQRAARRTAVARVHVNIGVDRSRDLRVMVVLTKAGWRIADVSSSDEPSLLRAIQASNRRARRAR